MQIIDELKSRPGFQILCRNQVYQIRVSKALVPQTELDAIIHQLENEQPEISFEVFLC